MLDKSTAALAGSICSPVGGRRARTDRSDGKVEAAAARRERGAAFTLGGKGSSSAARRKGEAAACGNEFSSGEVMGTREWGLTEQKPQATIFFQFLIFYLQHHFFVEKKENKK